jgi:hypothetical protein
MKKSKQDSHSQRIEKPLIVEQLTTTGSGELAFRAPGMELIGGAPAALILIGAEERSELIRPMGQAPVVTEFHEPSPAGQIRVRQFDWPEAAPDVGFLWRVGTLADGTGFTLQAAVRNTGVEPFRLREIQLLGAGATLVTVVGDPGDWHLHGLSWQGGTLAETLPSANERTRKMWEGFGMPIPDELPTDERANDGRWRLIDNVATLYSDKGGIGLYAGAVGEEANVNFAWHVEGARCALEVVSAMCDVRVDPGETRWSETVIFLARPYAEAAGAYFRWLAVRLGSRTHRGSLVGWCSWYDRSSGITAEHVIQVAHAIALRRDRLPMQTIQIDDGFQRQVGDWECNDKFPDGWKPVVEAIRDAKAVPGIWLAPLVAHDKVTFFNYAGEKENLKDGRIIDIHPDWFQRNARGDLNGSANNWTPTAHWLDPTHPGVQAFFRRIIRRAMQEGFRYFKIDFNTVGGRLHNPKKTHLQALRDLYRLYREEIGEESFLLSCSVLTRATIGLADASRIGGDSCAMWHAGHPCCIRDCIPAVANSAFANGVLYANDPDVTRTLPAGTLTLGELRVWHGFVGLLGGMALVSDNFSLASHQTEEALRMFEILTPPAKECGMPLHPGTDLMCARFGLTVTRPWGRFAAVQVYNALDVPADVALDIDLDSLLGCGSCHAWSFWSGEYLGLIQGGHVFRNLGAHSGVLLRLTPVASDPAVPLLVGTDLHITMGAVELREVRATHERMELVLDEFAGATNGNLVVHCLVPLTVSSYEGIGEVGLNAAGPGMWRVALRGRRKAVQRIVLNSL